MIVLKANSEQYKSLNGYQWEQSILQFVLDGNGDWIVGEEVLKDENFSQIHSQLEQLERVEYVPPINPRDKKTN